MRNKFLSILIIGISFIISSAYAEAAGIEGFVKDKGTGEELIGANVILLKTSIGAATDISWQIYNTQCPRRNLYFTCELYWL